ncbi:MAG: MFS transporter [Phycisphaerales bacterium]|nr:MFS transporter [Planctomycetota bacterium]MCH8507610.1 MFS transporter [Phycisphaerales bacterium]
MRWPPPFRSLAEPRAVFSWGIYDVANQSFQLLINTLLFPLFIVGVIVADDSKGRLAWFSMSAVSLGLIVVLSPVIGAMADQRAWKRELLLTTGVICATLTFALGFLQPGQLPLAIALYIIAAVALGLGENFLGSFLPEISTPKTVGRVSAIGWTMSYVGALVLLIITAAYATIAARDENGTIEIRPMLYFAGVWFGLGIIPAAIWLREKATPVKTDAATIIGGAFRRLAESARESTRYRQLARFYAAFSVYSMGTMTMIFGLGVIGDRLGFGLEELIRMALVVTVTGGLSAAGAGLVQDRLGHVRTISIFLGIWVLCTIAMAAAEFIKPPPPVYFGVAALIGLGLGGIGTSSRAIVGAFTPAGRSGEFFGLWGMAYKLAGMVGVGLFGLVSHLAGQPVALLLAAALFGTGWLLLLRIDEADGIRAAGHDEDAPAPARPTATFTPSE